MRSDFDVIIVGAGIAGACSAIALAPVGYRILLLDRAVFPRDKPCGEGIMPQGVAILEGLGLLPEILARGGTRFLGMRLRSLEGVWAQADFPSSGNGISFGVVMRRYHLDQLLLQRAKAFSNVTVREGFRVTEVLQDGQVVRGVAGHPVDLPGVREVFRSPFTIGADGMYSLFHVQCRLKKTYLRRRRFGVTGHLKGVEGLSSYVEIFLHRDGEIYVAPCGEVTLVALLLEERAMKSFKGDLAEGYMRFLRSAEGFAERMLGSELVPPVFAVGPLGFTVDRCFRPGLLLIGDSAGFLDPITGEGITLALKGVRAAVPVINEAFALGNFGADILGRYAAERAHLVDDLFRFTRFLLTLSHFKWIANRAIRRLDDDGRLRCKLMGVVTGVYRYRDLTFGERWSLVRG